MLPFIEYSSLTAHVSYVEENSFAGIDEEPYLWTMKTVNNMMVVIPLGGAKSHGPENTINCKNFVKFLKLF